MRLKIYRVSNIYIIRLDKSHKLTIHFSLTEILSIIHNTNCQYLQINICR